MADCGVSITVPWGPRWSGPRQRRMRIMSAIGGLRYTSIRLCDGWVAAADEGCAAITSDME
jgi:hypothetical protein